MTKKAIEYFDNIIMPLIRSRHSDILPEASMMILGSVGLGIDDELSDVEVVIYLPDEIWKQNGLLQITLDKCLAKTNLWTQEGSLNGSIICVHPLSWLLDNQGKKILANGGNVPWEKLSFESLFNMNENPIYYDPQDRLGILRRLTAPDKMPENLWKKAIYTKLHDFLIGGVRDIESRAKRNQYAAAHIQFGYVLQALYELGFLICHRYYPYHKHLRWAFGRLPAPVSELEKNFDLLSVTTDWQEKLNAMETIYNVYKNYMVYNKIAPELDFNFIDLHDMYIHNYLTEAVFFKAWDNPNWWEDIKALKEKTIRLGHDADEFWVVNWWEME
jgi:hypothetical protein